MTVVRRSRRYRRDERHEFDPGPCPDCGATGRFTVTRPPTFHSPPVHFPSTDQGSTSW